MRRALSRVTRRACVAGVIATAALVSAVRTMDAQPRTSPSSSRAIVVASKPFGESYILAEMFSQLLESRGYRVERRPGLGATEIAFSALRAGAVDVYPEYTGTGLLAILHEEPRGDARAVYDEVSRQFTARYGVRWLPPLGFENTYAIAVRRETAERYGLHTLSDLARAAPQLSAGLSADFIGRADGLPGLRARYGMRFARVRPLLSSVKYRALAAGQVDVVDGYSTDGLIRRYDLVVLRDDRAFFPPYEAAALVSASLAREMPGAVAALTLLSGRIGVDSMRAWNERVEVEGVPVARVARDALASLGLTSSATVQTAGTDTSARADDVRATRGTLAAYLWQERAAIARRTGRHLVLTGVSLLAAVLVAVPIGLALERRRGAAEGVVRAIGVLQTIPSIALLAFMIPLIGIGVVPALVALFLYSLYPIVRNTYTGVRDADPDAVAAATALGMTPAQVLRQVRLPLAAPILMAGIRTAAVIDVGTATLAAFIGAGGLGEPIVSGLSLADTRMILSGAIPAALLALAVDIALGAAERAVTPRGLR
ncbi:MAG TPA: glycine betaine ABC transporter substrate-binding protein [Gemmatimonadaceae bacterium]|nr:glycine betaine ABC transporter substrate-binding protein [Gemmatimonadaceae bacterium]